ncbi:MAG: MCP four helix bundle domain-containing protein [Bacteroidales bacterium]|nr:MCP four helix bundle domain-containing protein [Bacteroidales bacterium]
MGIKYKIFSGFMMLAIMLLVAGFVSIREFMNIGQSVKKLLDDNYLSIDASQTMLEALEREDSGILLLLLGKWQEGRQVIQSADSLFLVNYAIAKKNITIPGEAELVNKIKINYANYKSLWERPIVGTDNEGDFEMYYSQHHQLFLNVKHEVKNLMTLNQETMYQTSTELKNRSQRAVMPGIIAIVTAIVFSLLFVYYITYYFVRPIIQITNGIENYQRSNENFDVEVDTRDEIKKLADSVKRLLQSLS